MKHRSNLVTSATLACLTLITSGCLDVGQDSVSVPLRVAGHDNTEDIVAGDYRIHLQHAELAFGPLYLCAGFQAGALCETARAEWLGATVVNLLDAGSREVGELTGASGEVRSWMYDLGISSLLTAQEPLVMPAAAALGGNSLVLDGSALKDGSSTQFHIEMALQQTAETEQGVSLVRSVRSSEQQHLLTGQERYLEIRFDPSSWLSAVDFGNAAELVSVGTDTQAGRAVRSAVLAGKRPVFSWFE